MALSDYESDRTPGKWASVTAKVHNAQELGAGPRVLDVARETNRQESRTVAARDPTAAVRAECRLMAARLDQMQIGGDAVKHANTLLLALAALKVEDSVLTPPDAFPNSPEFAEVVTVFSEDKLCASAKCLRSGYLWRLATRGAEMGEAMMDLNDYLQQLQASMTARTLPSSVAFDALSKKVTKVQASIRTLLDLFEGAHVQRVPLQTFESTVATSAEALRQSSENHVASAELLNCDAE